MNQDVVTSLAALYEGAFGNLIVIVGIIVGFAGVVLPVGVALLQARQNRREAGLAREEIKRQVESAVEGIHRELLKKQAEALAAFQERSDSLVRQLKEEVEQKVASVRAHTLHLQAIAAMEHSNLVVVESAARSVVDYLKSSDYGNTRTVVAAILIPYFDKLSKDEFEEEDACVLRVGEAVDALKAANAGGQFNDLVRDMEKARKSCLARVPPAG